MGKWFSEDHKVMSRLPVIRRGACCLSGIKYLVSFPCSGDGFRNAASGVHAERLVCLSLCVYLGCTLNTSVPISHPMNLHTRTIFRPRERPNPLHKDDVSRYISLHSESTTERIKRQGMILTSCINDTSWLEGQNLVYGLYCQK